MSENETPDTDADRLFKAADSLDKARIVLNFGHLVLGSDRLEEMATDIDATLGEMLVTLRHLATLAEVEAEVESVDHTAIDLPATDETTVTYTVSLSGNRQDHHLFAKSCELFYDATIDDATSSPTAEAK